MTEPQITYGLGGWDPEHPNGNVVERVVDHGDGTGTRTFFGPDGQETGTEQVPGLPIPQAPEPVVLPLADEIATARALLISSATNTVLLTKQRAAALDALREQQLLAVLSPVT